MSQPKYFMKSGLILDLSLSFTNHTQPSTGPFNYASKYTCSLFFFIFTVTSFAQAVEQNTVLWLSTPVEVSGHICPLYLGIRIAKEHITVKRWLEQCFARLEKRQSKVSSGSGCQTPQLVSSLAADAGQVVYSHPFCTAAEGP